MARSTPPASSPDAAVDDFTHQPSLPTLELPEYHGRKPSGMRSALNGAGTRITRSHDIGDRVVFVVEGRVKSAGHDETDKDGLVYVEKIKVVDLFELDRDPGARLLSTMRSAYRTADDARNGKAAVDGLGDVGYVDVSGVALLPSEVASLRGDPVRVLVTEHLTPAVIVYGDGTRELWPDDFPKDAPRPFPGEIVTRAGEARLVDELLHHETGEKLTTAAAVAHGSTERAAKARKPRGERLAEQPDPGVEAAKAARRSSGDVVDMIDAALADPAARDEVAAAVAGAIDELDIRSGVPAIDAPDVEPTSLDEARLPKPGDFAFVDVSIPVLRAKLADVTDLRRARRLVTAERQGRGTGGTPRKDALKALEAHVAKLEAGK